MIIFWVVTGLFLLYHLWQKFFYVIILFLLSRGGRPIKKNNIKPKVSILVPAYNEEKVIARRIENLLSQNYVNKEIIVIESGSKDRTYDIAKGFGRKIKVLKQKKRGGKASAINFGLEHAKGEIILITDANAVFRKNTIVNIVRSFADPSVGGVCGRYLVSNPDTPLTRIVEIYWWIEYRIRLLESKIYSLTTFSGEITAFRKRLIKANDRNLSEDFDMALQVVRKGYRVVYEPKAVVYEANPTKIREEVVQKVRRAIGTMQTLFNNKDLLFNWKYGVFSWLILPSHKLSPLFHPFVNIAMLIALAVYFPMILAYLAVVALFLALIYVVVPQFRKVIMVPLYFVIIDYTLLSAWFKYLSGSYSVKWETTQSTRI